MGKVSRNELALDYLHEKFPGVPDEIFYRDYAGFMHETLDVNTIITACDCEKACEICNDVSVCLVRTMLGGRARPRLSIEKNSRGNEFFCTTWSPNYHCKFDEDDQIILDLLKESGLSRSQRQKTFERFETLNPDNTVDYQALKIKNATLNTAKGDTNLILAGKRGLGKTHLAIALMLYKIREYNLSSRFEVVAELLNKIRRAIHNNEDYVGIIDAVKKVHVLVLDDLGKEKLTDAARDYLFQIIDYRYRYELQTVITTNALTPGELISWAGDSDTMAPMISRMLERGKWLAFTEGEDRRLRGVL